MEAGRIRGRGIEWDAVRGLLSDEARTAMGREWARTAEPLVEPSAIESAVEMTAEARLALTEKGAPPLSSIPDARGILESCRVPGSVLEGSDLVVLLPLLDAAARLSAYGRDLGPVAPRIVALTGSLPRVADLADALRQALDEEGAVRDEASPRLRQLRRELRERRRRLVADLERLLTSADAERIFAERFVTLRHGRYVVPVRAEARTRVRGIVHDRSQSGQTLFVEPADAVDANNDLVQAVRDEEAEVARILAALTDAVRARGDELDRLVATVGELDWVFARGHLAERMDATRPVIVPDGPVRLRAARHPLLLAQSWRAPSRPVVPVDIEITRERPLLVITGPNAGGKTIALKTLALHALMAQVGCHLPADDGSRLPIFERLHAIIGDDQSVAENLSTFSAFVKQVREILDEADRHSLVLLDELGAGTDPDEGAALAQAILEELSARGALVMATTHLEPLKAFASTHPRARNASVEFDTATLAPTFRVVYDRPGQSYALTIAARLGLPPDLIERAQDHRSAEAARLSELLRHLDEQTRTEAERSRGIERREQEAVARLARAQEQESQAEARASQTLGRAKQEAAQLLAEVRRVVAAEWERLKKSDRSKRSLEEGRRRLNEASARIAPPPTGAPSPSDLAALVPGATVVAEHLGVRGRIAALVGNTATVRAGAVTLRIPLAALRPIAPSPEPRPAVSIRVPEKAGVGPELHLLGRTTDEARDMVEQYLDDAFMAGLPTVRLVHGKGTGALRKTVRTLLADHPLVASFRDGEPSEGGGGATVAALKVS
ncbi:MAG TPA: endonuclease MutS2 [Candidatus Acidoferrum sp.]|nr:endonuclease MutS2 [Candidatus Acidoferrum sp.]